MKITTTITVEVERYGGSYTKTVERYEYEAGGNPRFEAEECLRGIEVTVEAISRRIEDGAGR